MLQKCHRCVPVLQISATYMSLICLALYIFITTVCIKNFHHHHDQVRGLVYANMESGMQNYSSSFDIHQAAYILNNTLLLLLDFKSATFSGMQNYGEEKYEGVTQTWDVLQREVLASRKKL